MLPTVVALVSIVERGGRKKRARSPKGGPTPEHRLLDVGLRGGVRRVGRRHICAFWNGGARGFAGRRASPKPELRPTPADTTPRSPDFGQAICHAFQGPQMCQRSSCSLCRHRPLHGRRHETRSPRSDGPGPGGPPLKERRPPRVCGRTGGGRGLPAPARRKRGLGGPARWAGCRQSLRVRPPRRIAGHCARWSAPCGAVILPGGHRSRAVRVPPTCAAHVRPICPCSRPSLANMARLLLAKHGRPILSQAVPGVGKCSEHWAILREQKLPNVARCRQTSPMSASIGQSRAQTSGKLGRSHAAGERRSIGRIINAVDTLSRLGACLGPALLRMYI